MAFGQRGRERDSRRHARDRDGAPARIAHVFVVDGDAVTDRIVPAIGRGAPGKALVAKRGAGCLRTLRRAKRVPRGGQGYKRESGALARPCLLWLLFLADWRKQARRGIRRVVGDGAPLALEALANGHHHHRDGQHAQSRQERVAAA